MRRLDVPGIHEGEHVVPKVGHLEAVFGCGGAIPGPGHGCGAVATLVERVNMELRIVGDQRLDERVERTARVGPAVEHDYDFAVGIAGLDVRHGDPGGKLLGLPGLVEHRDVRVRRHVGDMRSLRSVRWGRVYPVAVGSLITTTGEDGYQKECEIPDTQLSLARMDRSMWLAGGYVRTTFHSSSAPFPPFFVRSVRTVTHYNDD